MDRANLGDAELEYEVHGSGEPVVFIHPGIYADWFTPLLSQPVLTDHYRLVHYHRAGCAAVAVLPGRQASAITQPTVSSGRFGRMMPCASLSQPWSL